MIRKLFKWTGIVVLKNGAVLLDILEQIVDGYIETAKAGGSQA